MASAGGLSETSASSKFGHAGSGAFAYRARWRGAGTAGVPSLRALEATETVCGALGAMLRKNGLPALTARWIALTARPA